MTFTAGKYTPRTAVWTTGKVIIPFYCARNLAFVKSFFFCCRLRYFKRPRTIPDTRLNLFESNPVKVLGFSASGQSDHRRGYFSLNYH